MLFAPNHFGYLPPTSLNPSFSRDLANIKAATLLIELDNLLKTGFVIFYFAVGDHFFDVAHERGKLDVHVAYGWLDQRLDLGVQK